MEQRTPRVFQIGVPGMGRLMLGNLGDLFGWLAIAAMFYALTILTCAISDHCAAAFMGPLL